MHGRHPLSETRHRSFEWNFGLIAMVLLAALSLAALLITPEIFIQ